MNLLNFFLKPIFKFHIFQIISFIGLLIAFVSLFLLYKENKQIKGEIKYYKNLLNEKSKIIDVLELQNNQCNREYGVLLEKYENLIKEVKKKEIEMNKKLLEYIEKEKYLSKIHEKYVIQIDKSKNECDNMKELIKKFEDIK